MARAPLALDDFARLDVLADVNGEYPLRLELSHRLFDRTDVIARLPGDELLARPGGFEAVIRQLGEEEGDAALRWEQVTAAREPVYPLASRIGTLPAEWAGRDLVDVPTGVPDEPPAKP
jgi:hypothetical protein